MNRWQIIRKSRNKDIMNIPSVQRYENIKPSPKTKYLEKINHLHLALPIYYF